MRDQEESRPFSFGSWSSHTFPHSSYIQSGQTDSVNSVCLITTTRCKPCRRLESLEFAMSKRDFLVSGCNQILWAGFLGTNLKRRATTSRWQTVVKAIRGQCAHNNTTRVVNKETKFRHLFKTSCSTLWEISYLKIVEQGKFWNSSFEANSSSL